MARLHNLVICEAIYRDFDSGRMSLLGMIPYAIKVPEKLAYPKPFAVFVEAEGLRAETGAPARELRVRIIRDDGSIFYDEKMNIEPRAVRETEPRNGFRTFEQVPQDLDTMTITFEQFTLTEEGLYDVQLVLDGEPFGARHFRILRA